MLYQMHRFSFPILLLVLAYMTYKGVDRNVFISVLLVLAAFNLILHKFFQE